MTKLETLSLMEILETYPQSAPILERYGLLGYAKTETAKHETLQASALVHSISFEQILSELIAIV